MISLTILWLFSLHNYIPKANSQYSFPIQLQKQDENLFSSEVGTETPFQDMITSKKLASLHVR